MLHEPFSTGFLQCNIVVIIFIIKSDDSMSFFEQLDCYMISNKSGRAGKKDCFHGSMILILTKKQHSLRLIAREISTFAKCIHNYIMLALTTLYEMSYSRWVKWYETRTAHQYNQQASDPGLQ